MSQIPNITCGMTCQRVNDGAGLIGIHIINQVTLNDSNISVRQNIGRVRQFLGCLGKLLRREVVDPIVSEKFYRAVVQAVIIFEAETWVLMAEMLQKLEGVHVGFLQQLAGLKARNMGINTWQK